MKKVLVLLSLVFILFGCGTREKGYHPVKDFTDVNKPSSYGNHQDVYVFSNHEIATGLMNSLKKEFGHVIEGAQKEKEFFLEWKSFDNFEDFKRAKNIIFVCNLAEEDALSALVRQKVPQEKIDYAENVASIIVTYQNEWADDQLISFIISRDEVRSKDIISLRASNMYLDYRSRFLKRMTKRAYYRGILNTTEFNGFPISLVIPETYQLYKKDEVEGYVSFLSRFKKKDSIVPDKFITVYYEEMDQVAFDKGWIIEARKEIGKIALDGDVVNWDRTKVMPKTINSWNSFMFSGYVAYGAWENPNTNSGGSFKSYAFYDLNSKKAYLIDTAVYYPAGTKIPYLLELEGIMKSYEIRSNYEN